jgi:dolichol kinase
MTELELLKKPEYIHVALNHLPIYGTILAALALAISLILRSRAAQITALILTLVAGLSAYPVFVTGQRAYKTIRNQSDDAGADWLDEHMDRAEKTIGVFYFLAALAIAGLLVPIKWPKSAVPLAALTLVVAILCSGIAVYIAQPGGRVRHPEFRPSELQLQLLKPITTTKNESIFTVSRFELLSRLCNDSSTAADS